jgi:hypothetical protein
MGIAAVNKLKHEALKYPAVKKKLLGEGDEHRL